MTTPTPPSTEGDSKPAGYPRPPQEGHLKNHTVTDQTGQETPLSGKVPQQSFKGEEEDFFYQASQVYEREGLLSVIAFVVAALFGLRKPTTTDADTPKKPGDRSAHVEKPVSKDSSVSHVQDSTTKWNKHLEAMHAFPIEQDPVVFFNFYHQLHTESEKVLNQDSAPNQTEDAPAKLSYLKAEAKKEISSRLSKIEEEITKQLPNQKLKQIAKKAKIPLSGASFQERMDGFTKDLNDKIEESQEKARAASGLLKDIDVREIPDLKRQISDCQTTVARSIVEKKERRTQEIEQKNTKKEELLKRQIEDIEKKLPGLKEQQKTLQEIKDGKVGIFFKDTLKPEEEKILDSVNDLVPVREKELLNLQNELKRLNLDAQKEIEHVYQEYEKEMMENVTRIGELEKQLKKKPEEKEKCLATIRAESAQAQKLEEHRVSFNQAWNMALQSQSMQEMCNQYARLSFLESVFSSYQDNPKKNPQELISTAAQKPFEPSKLADLGIPKDSALYSQAAKESEAFKARTPNLENIKARGLDQFQ